METPCSCIIWNNEQVGDENNWYLKKCRPSVENTPTNITHILSIKNLMWLMSVFSSYKTSVNTEMCCPKGKCGCQYFILLTLKKIKIVDTGVLDFLIKNNPGLLFFLPGPVFLFQIFIIAPLPSQGIYNCIINNKLINNKFRFSI
jgi:hypothetical protein